MIGCCKSCDKFEPIRLHLQSKLWDCLQEYKVKYQNNVYLVQTANYPERNSLQQICVTSCVSLRRYLVFHHSLPAHVLTTILELFNGKWYKLTQVVQIKFPKFEGSTCKEKFHLCWLLGQSYLLLIHFYYVPTLTT